MGLISIGHSGTLQTGKHPGLEIKNLQAVDLTLVVAMSAP